MTVVNPKSISGINSITTGSGSDNLLTIHTSDASSTERVRINSSGDVIVGSGITVSPDGDIFATGVCTATSFSGDGSSLTGIAATDNVRTGILDVAGVGTFRGDVNIPDKIIHLGDTNTAIRFPAADQIQLETGGSARLTVTDSTTTSTGQLNLAGNMQFTAGNPELEFNNGGPRFRVPSANTLTVHTGGGLSSTNNEVIRIDSDGDFGVGLTNPTAKLHAQDDSATETTILKLRNYKSSVNTKPSLAFEASTTSGQGATSTIQGLAGTDAGGSNSQNDSGMKFIVRHGGSGTEREAFTIQKDGNIHFPSGQGIDFSATGDGTGSGSVSELLDDYEEGTWSPSGSWTTIAASYTKIGRTVHAGFSLRANTNDGSNVTIGNLPFTSGSTYGHTGGITWGLCEFNSTDSWLNGSIDDSSTTVTVRRGSATIVTFGSGNNNMNQNAFIRGMIIYMAA